MWPHEAEGSSRENIAESGDVTFLEIEDLDDVVEKIISRLSH